MPGVSSTLDAQGLLLLNCFAVEIQDQSVQLVLLVTLAQGPVSEPRQKW